MSHSVNHKTSYFAGTTPPRPAKKDRRAKSFFLTHDKQTQDANCEHLELESKEAYKQPPASTNSRIVIQQGNFK